MIDFAALIQNSLRKRSVQYLRYRLGLFSLDAPSRRFIAHNRRTWDDPTARRNGGAVILVDLFRPAQGVIAISYFLNVLARKHNAVVRAFSSRNPYSRPELCALYSSFNTRGFVVRVLSRDQQRRSTKLFQEAKKRVGSKQELFDLTVDGAWIGIDVYESYLRIHNVPTVEPCDPRLLELLADAIDTLVFWRDYCEHNEVVSVVVSHDNYVHPDILCKVAYAKKIPVYLPNIRGMSLVEKPLSLYMPLFRNYPAMFRKLSVEEQEQGIQWAKTQLERQLSGEVGVDMPYSTKSAFGNGSSSRRVLKESGRIKVLICSHCFYDNPHGYGGMLFLDFYEWLMFLGKMSEKTDYDWYIKVHPDPLPGTEDVIRSIISRYPKIVLIPSATSHHQLAKEGLNFVLTVYGSIGHEVPLLGVQVMPAYLLVQAAKSTNSPEYREHATLYIREHPDLFRHLNVLSNLPPEAANLRLCVDTVEDFDLITRVFESLYPKNPAFTLSDILDLFAKHPELPKINQNVKQKSIR